MTWGIGWTFIKALKCLKNCTLMSYFCPKHIMFQLENVMGIMCYDTEWWCKTLKKTGAWLKNDLKNLVNFHASSQKSENLHFHGLALPKAFKFLDEKTQNTSNARSGQPENLHFDVLLLLKVYYVWAKMVQRSYLS